MIVLFLFVSSYVLASGNIPSGRIHQGSNIGKQAPNFTLITTSGEMKTFSKVRSSKKTILFFWATWCPHCHDELEQVKNHADDLKNKGIDVVLVDLGEAKEDVMSFIKASEMKMESFIDTDSILQDPYELIGVPTLYFIDENGIIRNITHALPDDYDAYFTSAAN